MDKAFLSFLSGQTKDSTLSPAATQTMGSGKGLDLYTNKSSTMTPNIDVNNKSLRNMMSKDTDRFFYILWHS
uniref:Uncharacterized protein n=1 Tax=Haematobia irritans TaxID=7368 RepID=A0A1L8E9X9_HAEIR